jgi:hypothetical protein
MRWGGWLVTLLGLALTILAALSYREEPEFGFGASVVIVLGPIGVLAFLIGVVTVYMSYRVASKEAELRREITRERSSGGHEDPGHSQR